MHPQASYEPSNRLPNPNPPPRGGRPLASVRDSPPPSRSGPKAPRGGGGGIGRGGVQGGARGGGLGGARGGGRLGGARGGGGVPLNPGRNSPQMMPWACAWTQRPFRYISIVTRRGKFFFGAVVFWGKPPPPCGLVLRGVHKGGGGTGGTSPRSRYATPPPPPPPCPPGQLSCQGSTATGHTYSGAEGARKFFFIPLAHFVHFAPQHYP